MDWLPQKFFYGPGKNFNRPGCPHIWVTTVSACGTVYWSTRYTVSPSSSRTGVIGLSETTGVTGESQGYG